MSAALAEPVASPPPDGAGQRFVALEDSGFEVDAEEIWRLFAPFVAADGAASAAAFERELRRRRRKIARRSLRRATLGFLPATQRRAATVIDEYTKAWRAIDYGIYSLDAAPGGFTPWVWRDRRVMASDVGATRFRQLLLIRMIEKLRPRTVLEVGCGNGINLLLLAGRFPEIRFTGVELTAAGHQAARRLQEQAVLPAGLQAFAPLPLADVQAFRRIDFVQGNAAKLPFAEQSFDLVYTVLALEQMERIREQALREIARVTARHTVMIEPFRDVNAALWPRLNVFRRDYFRGGIDDLPQFGLHPVRVLDDFPQEAFLRACAVICEKAG